jgi:hypothetical protein
MFLKTANDFIPLFCIVKVWVHYNIVISGNHNFHSKCDKQTLPRVFRIQQHQILRKKPKNLQMRQGAHPFDEAVEFLYVRTPRNVSGMDCIFDAVSAIFPADIGGLPL